MTDVGISIKVSSDGSVTVKKNFDAIGQSAEKALDSTERLQRSFGKLNAPTLRQAANDFRSIGTAALSTSNTIRSTSVAFGTFGTNARTAASTGVSAMTSFNDVVQRVKTSMSNFGSSIGSGVQTAISKLNALKTSLLGVRPAMAGIGTTAQTSSFNVANLASQFNDIGVTAAMMQNPLQIALQQGTQISQVFGNMGAAGAVKMLGQAFLSVISPLSLMTIGLVAGTAAFIQNINWSKVAASALTVFIKAVDLLRDNIDALRPYLIGIGTAMALAFGPSVLSMVKLLTVAIAKSLYSAVVGLFTLIMKNPIVAALTGVVTVISLIIEGTIGWQQALQGVIEWAGRAVEAVGHLAEFFGAGSWLTQKGLQIQINAKQAAQDLINAAKTMGNGLTDSLVKGAQSLKDGLLDGSETGGEIFKKKVATGADVLADKISQSVKTGGDDAAKAMGQSIKSSGDNVTYNLSTVMSDLLVGFKQFGGDLLMAMDQARRIVDLQISQMFYQVQLMRAQANQANAQAYAAKQKAQDDHRAAINRGSSSVGGGGGRNVYSKAYGYADGGRFKVGGTGSGRDTTPVAFRAERGERVTVETRKQQRANDNRTPTEVNVPVRVVNVFDPSAIPAANESVAGQRSILNVITANRDEIGAILGVY